MEPGDWGDWTTATGFLHGDQFLAFAGYTLLGSLPNSESTNQHYILGGSWAGYDGAWQPNMFGQPARDFIFDKDSISNIMDSTVCIPKSKYNELLQKVNLLNTIIDSESLTLEELERLKRARMGPSPTEEDFLKQHPELK